ncbi:MAG: acylphosphatase [Coriobacteriia bacterium]|nr:acylphosphatase [Coriobacteriia bacterium]MBN2839872.1 acylphosphatase [Coriobacteriia bacterium]
MEEAGSAVQVVRAHLSISGLVQGVYFRASTAEAARAMGVSGWVRNTRDGVEAVFEGPRPAVDRAIAWCHKGPPAAAVERVDTIWEEPEGLRGFSIRH